MHGHREEDEQQPAGVGEPARHRVDADHDDGEQGADQQEVGVHRLVHEVVALREVVDAREVDDEEAAAEEGEGEEGVRERPPDRVTEDPAQAEPCARAAGLEGQRHRCAEGQEHGSGHADEHVLRGVHAEQVVTDGRDAGLCGDGEHDEAGAERDAASGRPPSTSR